MDVPAQYEEGQDLSADMLWDALSKTAEPASAPHCGQASGPKTITVPKGKGKDSTWDLDSLSHQEEK